MKKLGLWSPRTWTSHQVVYHAGDLRQGLSFCVLICKMGPLKTLPHKADLRTRQTLCTCLAVRLKHGRRSGGAVRGQTFCTAWPSHSSCTPLQRHRPEQDQCCVLPGPCAGRMHCLSPSLPPECRAKPHHTPRWLSAGPSRDTGRRLNLTEAGLQHHRPLGVTHHTVAPKGNVRGFMYLSYPIKKFFSMQQTFFEHFL